MVLKTSLLVFWVGSSHGLKFKQLMLSLRVGPRKWLSIGWIKVLHLILIGEWSCQKRNGYHRVNVDKVKVVVDVGS